MLSVRSFLPKCTQGKRLHVGGRMKSRHTSSAASQISHHGIASGNTTVTLDVTAIAIRADLPSFGVDVTGKVHNLRSR